MSLHHLARGKFAVACLLLLFVASGQSASSQVRFEAPPDPLGFSDARKDGSRPSIVGEASRAAADGDLDPTFAATLDWANGFAYAVEEQQDGKVLVAGGFKSINGLTRSGIIRFNADRSIDTSFVPPRIRGTVYRIAIQQDGKILLAGAAAAYGSSMSNYGVARLNADGSFDTTFNVGSGPNNRVRDIILQPDGKILIAGDFMSVNGESRFGVARLNEDGSVDPSLGSPLVPSQSFTGAAGVTGIGLQPNGKIILCGVMNLAPTQVKWVLRLNTNGSPDDTFVSPSMSSNPYELAVQPDGKIIVVGFFTTVNTVSRPRIARLNVDGGLDTTFDPGTGANSSALFVRVLASGKILVSGAFTSFNGAPRGRFAQLNSNGSLDVTFAPTGTTVGTVYSVTPTAGGDYYVGGSFTRLNGSDRDTLVSVNSDASIDEAFVATSLQFASIRAVASQPDGKVIVGGFFNRFNGSAVNSLLRLNPTGTVDPTFAGGVTITGAMTQVLFQADGKLLVLGSDIRINNGASQAMVRLNADGTPDSSFTLTTITQIFTGLAAAVQPDGKIVFSYLTSSTDPNINSGLVRLNSDGSIDGSVWSTNRQIESIAILPNGQIMVAGPFAFAYVSSGGMYEPHNAIMRLDSNGAHDRTFRSALTAEDSNISAAYAMYLQPDGKVLVGGKLFTPASPATLTGVARLNASGTIDGTFQTTPMTGIFRTPIVYSLQPAADGKILVGGYFDNLGGPGHTNIARLQGNGVVDPSFTASTDDTVLDVAIAANGSVILGGAFENVNGTPRTALARLLSGPASLDRAPFDFDGDGKTDIGIFRPVGAFSEWWINRSSTGSTLALQFGASTDKIAPADFTGDGKADIAFFRPASGEWYILRSENFSFFALPFGANGDIPVPADYDADGKADFAVFRPSSATWFISQSSGAPTRIEQFGAAGDQPVVSDYDGDGKADIAIFRAAGTGAEWWINRSTAGVLALQFGASTDKPVQGDYTGDGKTDIAIWKPASGEWFIVRSEDFSFYGFPFGASGDVIAPGDYDGDGKFDPTVFRPASATWFIARTTAGTQIVQFGANGDRPLPNAFVP